MITKALVGMSALAAAVAMFFQTGAPADTQTLGGLLDKAMQAKSLKFSVDRNGKKSDVLVSLASHVRWQESKTKYRIANSNEAWEIDTEAGEPQLTKTAWHDKKTGKVDMLALLGVQPKQSKEWRGLVASKPELVGGKRRFVFNTKAGQPVLHAYCSVASNDLLEVRCWPNGWNPNVPPSSLLVVARDIVVDDSVFVVAKKLVDDGRIGKITDSQGIVTLRPKMNKRWTPVARHMLLKPGDWVRTDARGANASTLVTASAYKLIVGPGSLLETISATEIRLHRGEINVAGSKSAEGELKIVSPGDTFVTVGKGSSTHLRATEQRELEAVKRKPVWLAGYQGKTNVDTTGSLLANIDGRETPLTIGYHKVHVEIRDQIARTTIEESFVNHTGTRLEGVFHFPLPQDASISGFGMWIDGELVEADVVEKQRAREIFETILREKRDPGLLEWTGGNIFKARVFPILPSQEKRIKIVYTQVLPQTGNKFRYSYGLRSEMLQTTPLRELEIDVQVHSSLPIQSIGSSTHAVRTIQTDHSAKLEFEAQEYTPKRDFEVVCELDQAEKNVVLVPHQRGNDGYFLAQFALPEQAGWKRETIKDGEPLGVLIVCDTSASMDSVKRTDQKQFVTALLSGLGDSDRFDIAYCDVDCGWLNNELVPASEGNVDRAIDWLDQRISLGWTDLDGMLATVLPRAKKATQVVYIGDGIVSTVDADPQAFVNRLQRVTKKAKGDFHVVSVGNSFEATVLNALAGVGAGSVRGISGEQTPPRVALELLTEISNPRLTNLKFDFRGVNVAAVYPKRLPNLSAGKQQILVGRYLPVGSNQSGELVVTGKLGGKSVKYSTPISLANAESGNSFIPRLWARGHLDHLLSQGSGPLVRDQVIGLSEEFHIMTPYTSLLVLESDSDRERFGVKRRMEVRDGEQFFADGRKKSNYELLQKQMKAAGDWRLALRRKVLSDLSQLGRDPRLFMEAANDSYTWGGVGGGGFGGGGLFITNGAFVIGGSSSKAMPRSSGSRSSLASFDNLTDLISAGERADLSLMISATSSIEGNEFQFDINDELEFEEQLAARAPASGWSGEIEQGGLPMLASRITGTLKRPSSKQDFASVSGGMIWNGQSSKLSLAHLFPFTNRTIASQQDGQILGDEKAITVLKSLVQPARFEVGGIQGTRTVESFDLDWDRVTETSTKNLIAKERWAFESELEKHWFDSEIRSAHHKAFQTIKHRPSSQADAPMTDLERPFATTQQLAQLSNLEATILEENNDVVIIRVGDASNTRAHRRITIDKKRKVVTSIATFSNWKKEGGLPYRVVLYGQHKKVAGVWWPTKIEYKNRDKKTTGITTQDLRSLSKSQFDKAFREFVPSAKNCVVLTTPVPSVRDSHIAILQGKSTLQHHYVLLHEDCNVQDWDRAAKHLAAIEKLASGKPAVDWIRFEFLKLSVQHDQASMVIDQIAETSTQNKEHGLFLANSLASRVSGVLDNNETLGLLDKLRQIYVREESDNAWLRFHIQQLRSLGDPRTIELQKQLAIDEPWNNNDQLQYSQDLKNSGDLDGAIAWLEKQIEVYPGNQTPQSYVNQIDRFLYDSGRSKQLVEFYEKQLQDSPANRTMFGNYLTALLLDGRSDESAKIAMDWMKSAQVDGELDEETESKLMAAIGYGLGQRPRVYLNWMHPKWHQPLAEVARFFLESEHHPNVTQQLQSNYRFTDSREADELSLEIAERVRTNVDTLAPKAFEKLLPWIVHREMVSEKQWQEIADSIRARWDSAESASERTSLARTLISILDKHFHDTELFPFLRKRVERAVADGNVPLASMHRRSLLNTILSEPIWTQEHETEAFALLKTTHEGQKQTELILSNVSSLFQLVEAMYTKRVATEQKNFEAVDHPEEFTRQKLARQRMKWEQNARTGLIAALGQHSGDQDELSEWFLLEKIHQQVKAGEDLKQAEKECWRILGDTPTPPVSDQEFDKLNLADRNLELSREFRRERAIEVLSYLAVRRSSTKRLRNKVLAYLEAGEKIQVDDPTNWRLRQSDLLVALDRPEELKAKLLSWVASDPFPITWQALLANLHAELGEVADAIRLMETVQSFVRLSPQQSSSLSKWRLVSDNEDKYDAARRGTYESTPDYLIANWLDRRFNELNSTKEARVTEVDDKVLDAFSALMTKSSNPQQQIHRLKKYYKATRDFRLLKMLPEACIGRSAQSIYETLSSISSSVLSDILKEATLDKIVDRIDELRAGELTKLDARALDLLETMIQRRAADVINEPGPHIQKAKEAMQRAFARGNWQPGEIKQMATFLASLSTLYKTELRQERARQFKQLLALTESGTEVRFYVHWQFAHSIAWSDGNHDNGIAEMQVAIADYKNLHPNGFPSSANQPVFDYARMLGYRGLFVEAEEFLRPQVKTSINEAQRIAYLTQLNSTLIHALRDGGQVSLGTGQELYASLRRALVKQATNANHDNERSAAINSILKLFRVGDEKNFASVDNDLWKFASQKFAGIAEKQTNNHQALVETVLNRVEKQLGDFKALEFSLIMFETVPDRRQLSRDNLWNRLGYKFAKRLHKHAKKLGKLEQRALKIVEAELEFDLTVRNQRGRYCYSQGSTYFWSEKRDDFAAVAESVLDTYKESGRHVEYIAQYLYEYLSMHDRAIVIMLEAHENNRLQVSGKSFLAKYLTNQKRAKEAVPILKAIIAQSPDTLHYRIQLLRAYAATNQSGKWDATLKATDEHFRKAPLWNHRNTEQIAKACLDAKKYELAAGYYKEAISALRRNPTNRYNDQYALSSLYQQLADVYAGLKDTPKAVDAISAAMIVWRTDKNQRQNLGYALQRVLRKCDDLTAYVKSVDRQAAKTGMDSPFLRKHLGNEFFAKRKLSQAVTQLRAAIDLQPNDIENHKKLIAVFKLQKDKESVVKQSLKLIDIEKHNLENYRQLVEGLSDDPAMSERAITTIIEAAPNEAEHHQAVAELRDKTRDFEQAISHWKQVAKLRKLEPTGLLGLAKSQIAAKKFEDAKSTLKQVQDTQWDQRFSSANSEAENLKRSIQ